MHFFPGKSQPSRFFTLAKYRQILKALFPFLHDSWIPMRLLIYFVYNSSGQISLIIVLERGSSCWLWQPSIERTITCPRINHKQKQVEIQYVWMKRLTETITPRINLSSKKRREINCTFWFPITLLHLVGFCSVN